MPYNNIIDQVITEISYSQEPVTLDETKAYCRVEVNVTAQDQLFGTWINAARNLVERMTGLSLVPKSIVSKLQNQQGNIEVPFGPVTNAITYLDYNGQVPTIYTQGDNFPRITYCIDYLQCTYTAGYTTDSIPRDLKVAIMIIVNSWYENRGDESTNIPSAARVIIQKHSRIGVLG